jgi:hypothetical protein
MATVNKDFKIKNGLIVEGTTGTIDSYDILTKHPNSIDYIIDQVGGDATSSNTPNTIVKRNGSGNFSAGVITANLTGDVTGTVSDISNHDTGDLAEGANLYYTNDRARGAVSGDTGLDYDSNTGVFSIDSTVTTNTGTQTLTNKTIALGSNSVSGTLAEFNTAVSDADLASLAGSETLTNKTIALGSNSVSGTLAQFNTAVSDADLASLAGTETLTNKTIALGSNSVSGTLAQFNTAVSDADLVSRAGTETLTNKTLTSPVLGGVSTSASGNIVVKPATNILEIQGDNSSVVGQIQLNCHVNSHGQKIASQPHSQGASNTLTLPGGSTIGNSNAVLVSDTGTQTLSNKTISYSNNTITVQVANVSDLSASAAELNTLDGITASTAELNILDGVTATTTELNYVDGVTDAIQTQLDSKAPLASPSLTGNPTAPTASAGTNSTQIATTAYVETAVANLVDGAPGLLDTLNELAAAIGDDENFASTLTASVGEKVAKSGDTMTGALTLNADPSNNLHAATKQYVDAAQAAAESYADSLAGDYEASGSVSAHSALTTGVHGITGNVVGTTEAQILTNKTISGSSNTISNIANASLDNDSITINGSSTALGSSITLNTDDISEGTNQYFTENRAKDAAGYILENATQTNISITYDEGTRQLAITAENGVDDSTTDDLDEGSTNLYFTNTRARSAVDGTDRSFTAVEINDIAKQVAASAAVATASTVTATSWAKADYRSAKFFVKFETSTHSEVSEILLTLDSSDNVAITEYAIVNTNGNLGTVSADVSGADVRLRVTTLNNSTDVMVYGTLLV